MSALTDSYHVTIYMHMHTHMHMHMLHAMLHAADARSWTSDPFVHARRVIGIVVIGIAIGIAIGMIHLMHP